MVNPMAIVSIELPLDIYERLQREAEQSSRSLEQVLLEDLALLSDSSVMDLTVQDSFSDQKLWAIVYQNMGEAQAQRTRDLIADSKERPLTSDEQAELEYLIELGDRYVLLRSQALLILKERGHNINSYLNRNGNSAVLEQRTG
jgi:hypothetical protein